MAVDASSVSVVLGASSFGPGVVVTSAGIVFAQAASAPGPTSAAYWYYNGTSLIGNAPAGASYRFGLAGVSEGYEILSNGVFTSLGNIAYVSGKTDLYLNRSGTGSTYIEASAVRRAAFQAVAANPTDHVGQTSTAHLAGGSTALTLNTCRIGLGAGTTSSGTAVTASGHDMAGRVGVTINSTGTANQPILLVAFATAYNTPPFVALTPGNAAAAALAVNVKPHVVTTTSGFAIMGAATGITTGASYVWYYSAVIQ